MRMRVRVRVRASGERIADLLRGRLLALWLHAGRNIVALALEHIPQVFRVRLLRVGLHRCQHGVPYAKASDGDSGERIRTLMAAMALSVKLWRPASDIIRMIVEEVMRRVTVVAESKSGECVGLSSSSPGLIYCFAGVVVRPPRGNTPSHSLRT